MIYNSSKIYATVWNVKVPENGKYLDLQITTSEKNGDGEYLNSSWFPRCIGKSVNTLKGLKERDRIVITKSKFTNERVKQEDDTYKSYFRFIILEAEIDTDGQSTPKPTASAPKKTKTTSTPAPQESAEEDSECPW